MALYSGAIGRLKGLFQRAIGFARRQTHDFRVMLARRALHGIGSGSGLSAQYGSINATLLGADAVQLGSLGSVGNAISALASIPTGWFIDYYSLKKVFLLGTVMLVLSRVFYFVAPHWAWLYAGAILYYLGVRITCTVCTVTCATELPNEERRHRPGVLPHVILHCGDQHSAGGRRAHFPERWHQRSRHPLPLCHRGTRLRWDIGPFADAVAWVP